MPARNLYELAEDVAAGLTGGPWIVTPFGPADDDNQAREATASPHIYGRVRIHNAAIAEASITLTAYDYPYNTRDRLNVSGSYPRQDGHIFPTRDKERPGRITLDKHKDPRTIAKEISNRLLAAYVPALRAGVKERDDIRDRRAAAQAIASELARMIGTEVNRDPREPGFSAYEPTGPYVRSKYVDSEHVELEVCRLTHDEARRLIRFLYPRFPEEDQEGPRPDALETAPAHAAPDTEGHGEPVDCRACGEPTTVPSYPDPNDHGQALCPACYRDRYLETEEDPT